MSVGIDIGSKTIKVVELSRTGNSYLLKSAGAVGFAGNTIEKMKEESEFKEFGSLIKKLLQDAHIQTKKVIVSLPDSQVFTRIMKFPLLNNEEIESAVKWEAEEYIPIPIAEATMRHQILERQEVGNPPQVLVQVIAVNKALVEKYTTVARFAGLEVQAVETELNALARLYGDQTKTVMIAEVGARGTTIGVIKNAEVFFSRNIPSGGDAFSRAVAMGLGVSPTQAEEYKKTYGFTQGQLEGKVTNAITPVARTISDELKKASQYFQLDTRSQPPTSLVISGGSAALPGFTNELTKMLGIEVSLGNPFQTGKVNVDPESLRSLANYAPLYSIAVGLAMRD